MKDMKKFISIIHDIIDNDLLEDRLEYDVEDLSKVYDLTKSEAEFLYGYLRELADTY